MNRRKNPKRDQINIRVSYKEWDYIKRMSEDLDRSISSLIREAMADHSLLPQLIKK